MHLLFLWGKLITADVAIVPPKQKYGAWKVPSEFPLGLLAGLRLEGLTVQRSVPGLFDFISKGFVIFTLIVSG